MFPTPLRRAGAGTPGFISLGFCISALPRSRTPSVSKGHLPGRVEEKGRK